MVEDGTLRTGRAYPVGLRSSPARKSAASFASAEPAVAWIAAPGERVYATPGLVCTLAGRGTTRVSGTAPLAAGVEDVLPHAAAVETPTVTTIATAMTEVFVRLLRGRPGSLPLTFISDRVSLAKLVGLVMTLSKTTFAAMD